MSFVKKSIFNTVGMGVHTVVNIVISIILARILKPEGVGKYQLLISTATIVGAIGTLGLGKACVYFINSKKKNPTLVSSISFRISIVSGLAVATFLIIALHSKAYFGFLPRHAILITAGYGVLVLFMENLYPLLLVTFQVKKNIVVNLIPRIFFLLSIIIGFRIKRLTVDVALMYAAVGMVLGVGLLVWYVREWISFRIKTDYRELKTLASYGSKLNLSYVALLLNGQIGLLIIRYFLSDDFSQVGYYSRAMNVCSVLFVVTIAIGPLLHSKWSSVDSITRQLQVERASRVLCLFLGLALIILEPFSSIIIETFYGIEFSPAIAMMRILLIGIGARFLLNPLLQLFTSGGRPLSASLILVLNLSLMVVLMMFLVPSYGGIGASIAFSTSNVIGLFIAYFLSSKRFGVRPFHCLIVNKADLQYFFRAIKS